tara:strand:- start:901 stop:1143 length:243 start_codon:yes stop_codon:yes gene_type:complete
MFINISQKVRVYLSIGELQFLEKYRRKHDFRQSELDVDEINIAKTLASKSILVRKKLIADTQYAVNRSIRVFNHDHKKQI